MIKVSQSFCFIVQTRYKIRLETAITFAHPLSIFLFINDLHAFYFCTPRAVEIVDGAMTQLKERGIEIDPAHQSKIVGNLLAIICGDAKVQPTYAVQDYDSEIMTESMHKMVDLLDGIKKQLSAKSS